VTFRVVILPRAKQQLLDQALWWSEHRSAEQAYRWLDAFENVLASLGDSPDRYPVARENDAFEFTVRELHFGIRGRATHRAVFEIRANEVIVFAVRHLAQADLIPDDPTTGAGI
jgi:plasmid stabilization system protein ParE